MIFIRPFEKISLNIILIQNEIFFLFFSSYLIYFNSESRWDNSLQFLNSSFGKLSNMKTPETVFIFLMTISGCLVLLISIIDSLVRIIRRLISRYKSKVAPRPNNYIIRPVTASIIEE